MSTVIKLVSLRSGSVGDLATVEAIMADAFDPQFGEAWTRGQCLGIMTMPGVWLTLADLDGRTVGFALSRIIADEAELLLLATLADAQRQGVGRALVRGVEADARAGGATALHLEVRSGNDAIKLYLATGFSKAGVRRDYYRGNGGQMFDAFTFRRQLDQSL